MGKEPTSSDNYARPPFLVERRPLRVVSGSYCMNLLSGRCLEIGYGAAEGLAASMVRQWLSIFCGVAQVEHHQYFFIFGKFHFSATSSGLNKFTQQLSAPAFFAASIMCVATMVASSMPESRVPPG